MLEIRVSPAPTFTILLAARERRLTPSLFFPSFLLPSPPLPPSCITVTPKIRPFSTDKRRIKDRISGVEEEEESRGVTRRVNDDLVVGIFVLRVVWRLDKK